MNSSSGLGIKRLKQRIMAGPQSMRSELIVSILLGLLAIFLPVTIANGIRETDAAVKSTQDRLVQQGTFVYLGVTKWRASMTELLKLLAFAPQVRTVDKQTTEISFNPLSTLLPHRSWRLWIRYGDLLVGTNCCGSRPPDNAGIHAKSFSNHDKPHSAIKSTDYA